MTQLQQLETLTMSNWVKCASHNRPQENSTKMCAYQCGLDNHCLLIVAPYIACLFQGVVNQ